MVNPLSEFGISTGKKKLSEDELIRMDVLFMKEFGYTPQELDEIPIPTWLCMCEVLNKEYKKEKEKMDRMNRRK